MEILGPPSASFETVVTHLGTVTPLFREQILPALWASALKYGVVPEGVVAQSIKETGGGSFLGNVKPWFNNTCGLKVRNPDGVLELLGSSDQNHPLVHAQFPSWAVGAEAHVQHLVAYTGNTPAALAHRVLVVDPRYVWVVGRHRLVHWAELGGIGKWARSDTYGTEIEAIIARLRGQ